MKLVVRPGVKDRVAHVLQRRSISFAVAILLSGCVPAFAANGGLERRATEQRQARAMARDLVTTVLDLQLRQLEENGLTELPLYRDIQTMRGDLSDLVDGEMAAVIDQLAALEKSTDDEREAKLAEVRRTIRNIVVRLSVERRTLLRRLKSAEIAEQTRRLIALQSDVRDATAALPSRPAERRPTEALQVLEDQRDVQSLFDSLTESLADIATWDGPVATVASDGLRMLNDATVGRSLEEAGKSLEEAAFNDATQHQQNVLESLRKLLTSIERAQGVSDSATGQLADAIAAIRERQQRLREHVEQTDLDSFSEAVTVKPQQEIATAIAGFTDELAGHTTAEPLRAQAEAAARAATEALFVADQATTLAEQKRTVDRLTVLEQTLRQESDFQRNDRSAAELARAIEELRQTRDELQHAAETQQEAMRLLAEDPSAAGTASQTAAGQAQEIVDGIALPAPVAARIADAAVAARKAADRVASTAEESPAASQTEMAAAGDAFQRARAAVEESLANLQRSEVAVRIGEMARAAEAIERAAAAERELAVTAAQPLSNDGDAAARGAALQQIQSDVTAVTEKSAAGVRDAAPQAAETLDRALASSKQVQSALVEPQEVMPSPSVVEHADETARLLTEAATQLRREIGSAANSLADSVDMQLSPVATAQQTVQQGIDALRASPAEATATAQRAAEAAALAEVDATTASQIARRSLEGEGTVTDARDAYDRAAISLAAREQRLRQDQQLARQLAQLAERQQSASDSIAASRQSLAEAPADPAAMTPRQQEQARSLHSATRQFAAAQRATGQGAAMVSGQQQVMNPPIREALQAAERLPVPQLPGEPIDEQVAQASEPSQPAENGERGEGEAGEGSDGQSSNSPSQQTASSGEPGQAANASSANGTPQPTGLGTGLVPAAPDETARMMAGPEAQAALAAMAAAAGTESIEDVAATDTNLDGELPEGMQSPESMNDSQTDSAQGTQTTAAAPADSDSQSPTSAPRDVTTGTPARSDAPWFATLPPEVRAAIRASSSQPAPKGYEGRLKRYFESVE